MFRLLALVALCAAPLNGYMMQRAAGDMLGMTNPDSMMGHMDMGGDIHAHHRCCAHDVWHGTIYFEETALKNGSMTPTLEEAAVMVDHDFNMKMERWNISYHDVMNGTYANIVMYKDYNNMKTYTIMNGMCTVEHSMDMMHGPCIPGEFHYGGSLNIGGGMDTLTGYVWTGMRDGAHTSLIVTEDCTPVTETTMKMENGDNRMVSMLFTDMHQGMLSSSDALMLPQMCQMAKMPAVGK